MKVALICFTINGYVLGERIEGLLEENGDEVSFFTKSRYLEDAGKNPVMGFLHEWTGRMFETKDALIFIGAAGICVRAIAPFLKSKQHDPAVIVIDELGKYCIPVLSGHLGGANDLALLISQKTGSEAVITTATDINGLFSVDVFAKKNKLKISDMALAREVSARLLANEKVGFKSELKINGPLPEGLCDDESLTFGIYIGIYKDKSPYENTLFLIPEILCAGIGCKKGKSAGELEAEFNAALLEEGIDAAALCAVGSIDMKAEEPCLNEFCAKRRIKLKTYSASELESAPGDYTASEFVRLITTVDNVCERSAVLLSEGGQLILRKRAKNGITIAFAAKQKEIDFE